jgi:hypothetical protein
MILYPGSTGQLHPTSSISALFAFRFLFSSKSKSRKESKLLLKILIRRVNNKVDYMILIK